MWRRGSGGGGGPAPGPHHQDQLGLIWWTRVKPPLPSMAITHTVCLTSCALVNWNGPSGVWMLTDSIADRSLSRSTGRSENVRFARLAASARILIAAQPWAPNWSGCLFYLPRHV